MLEVSGLTKSYGEHLAIEDISFTAQDGEIIGLLGRNGAGKSTTMNIITGYISTDSGSVSVCGDDMLKEPLKAKKHIGYLPENPPIYLDMTVIEYLTFVCRLKGMPHDDIPKHAEAVCERVGLSEVNKRLIGNLSKGFRQRVGLAQALCGDANVIILDEPTVGLDPMQIIEIRTIIKDLRHEHTVIVSSHILSEISDMCDRLIILNQGRIVAADTLAELTDGETPRLIVAFAQNDTLEADALSKELSVLQGVQQARPLESSPEECAFLLTCEKGRDARARIFTFAVERELTLLRLESERTTLEDVFTRLTQA